MKLTWTLGTGPETTQELADEILREGRLCTGVFRSTAGRRCLWGVICGVDVRARVNRSLAYQDAWLLQVHQLDAIDNDAFKGTQQARCQEMARRMRAIP